jgi:hypothetical protein
MSPWLRVMVGMTLVLATSQSAAQSAPSVEMTRALFTKCLATTHAQLSDTEPAIDIIGRIATTGALCAVPREYYREALILEMGAERGQKALKQVERSIVRSMVQLERERRKNQEKR